MANSFLASKMRKSPSGKMRVLIVDDCVVPRKSLKRMIQKLDFPVECDMAKSGEEGILMVKELVREGGNYDLIFMDEDMHDTFTPTQGDCKQLQGHAAVSELRRMNYTFPIVMRTNRCDYNSVKTYRNVGANAVLPKSTPNTPLRKTLKTTVQRTESGQLSDLRFCEGLIMLQNLNDTKQQFQVLGSMTPGPPKMRVLDIDEEVEITSDKIGYRRLQSPLKISTEVGIDRDAFNKLFDGMSATLKLISPKGNSKTTTTKPLNQNVNKTRQNVQNTTCVRDDLKASTKTTAENKGVPPQATRCDNSHKERLSKVRREDDVRTNIKRSKQLQ
ncbi:hypothetical protein AAMO2058_000243900 [Amorphochlora amoebiformis]